MTIKRPSRSDLRAIKANAPKRPENRRAEKHFRNAFKPHTFNTASLTEADLDELGITDDNDYFGDPKKIDMTGRRVVCSGYS